MSDRTKPPPGCREPFQIPADQPHDPNDWWAWDDGYTTRDQAVEAQHRLVPRIKAEALRELLPAIRTKLGEVSEYQENGYGVAGVLDAERYLLEMIERLADELDPGGPKGHAKK
jgi:hypothetical protein